MSIFELDPVLIEHAIADKYVTTSHPGNAALGRIAQQPLVELGAAQLGHSIRILPYHSKDLPEKHKFNLGKDYRHDGLIFDAVGFFGVAEAKLEIDRGAVGLSKNEHDMVFKYCKANGIPYLLMLGKYLGGSNHQCKYLGIVDLIDFDRKYPDTFADKSLKHGQRSSYFDLKMSDLCNNFI